MPALTYLLIALVSYLLGSIPFGFLLVRLFRKEDIRSVGSGNIGATNVVRSGAKGLGALTFFLDVCKGCVAVLASAHIAFAPGLAPISPSNAAAVAALGAILGHIYTVWLGLKGGKGVATAFGVFLAIAPWAALASLVVFLLIFVVFRYVSLGSILGSAAFPLFAFLLPHATYGVWLAIVVFLVPAIVIVKHHANIVRLLRGTEYRFGKTGKTPA